MAKNGKKNKKLGLKHHKHYLVHAIEAATHSEHGTNKIGATIVGHVPGQKGFCISRSNFWPEPIKNYFDPDEKIGASSGTVHAEVAVLMAAPLTKGTAIYVTDPPCPNCMKYMAEAGVAEIYIDADGFKNDWMNRRKREFHELSMRIATDARMHVYRLDRNLKGEYEPTEIMVNSGTDHKKRVYPHATCTREKADKDMDRHVEAAGKKHVNRAFAVAAALNGDQSVRYIITTTEGKVGHRNSEIPDSLEGSQYAADLQPLNRLLMTAKRRGLEICPETVHTSRVPTSRELVNYVGYGGNRLTILDPKSSRNNDPRDLEALDKLITAGALRVTDYEPAL